MITDENIDDILCTAFEGGINYWCSRVEVIGDWFGAKYASEVVSKGGRVKLINDEEPDREPLTLLKENVVPAIEAIHKRVMDNRGRGRRSSLEEWLEGEYDAGDADMIVQQAVFGELVYG